ncbi:Gfo/Idh/MocA family oxidoreductase [Planktomarina sp.]|nr:Gfo/Idh/MocA family oxidoreductase [Planktomarina sp.]
MFVPIVGRKIKIAVAGCGRISKLHIEAISKLDESFELVALCDIDKKVLEKVSKNPKINYYEDFTKMLDKEDLDVVALCTPSGLHSLQTQIAASYKVNVITEKPMATRWSDGLKMVSDCDLNNVRLFVVKQNRHNPTLKLLKRAMMEKRFGRVSMVNVNVFWTRPQEYYDGGNGWRGTWEYDGGALMNQASHYVDLLDWLVGPVEKVHAFASTTREIETEDTAVLNVKWRNGALGSMNVTMLTYPKNLEGSITILGETGTVRIGGVALNDITTWTFSQPKDYDQLISNVSYDTKSVYGNGHKLYYEKVKDALRGLIEPETDGRAGLKSLEVLIAAYHSIRDNHSVGLPLEHR